MNCPLIFHHLLNVASNETFSSCASRHTIQFGIEDNISKLGVYRSIYHSVIWYACACVLVCWCSVFSSLLHVRIYACFYGVLWMSLFCLPSCNETLSASEQLVIFLKSKHGIWYISFIPHKGIVWVWLAYEGTKLNFYLQIAPGFYKFVLKYCPYLQEHKGYFRSLLSHVSSPNGKLHVVSEVSSCADRPHATVNVTTEDGHTHTHKNVALFSHMLEPRVFASLGYTNLREYAAVYKNSKCVWLPYSTN